MTFSQIWAGKNRVKMKCRCGGKCLNWQNVIVLDHFFCSENWFMTHSCSFFPMFCYCVSFSGVVSVKANTFCLWCVFGQVFCAACCSLKSRLMYMDRKEARVCVTCHRALMNGEWYETHKNSYTFPTIHWEFLYLRISQIESLHRSYAFFIYNLTSQPSKLVLLCE